MVQSKNDKINLNCNEEVLNFFHELTSENPSIDEMAILSAVTFLAGLEIPPRSKSEGKRIVMEILNKKQ